MHSLASTAALVAIVTFIGLWPMALGWTVTVFSEPRTSSPRSGVASSS